METAFVLLVPEADPAVSSWRERYDPSAALGVPAHITVLVPFMPYADIDAACTETLTGIFHECAPLDLTFGRLERFADTLWLAPEPAEPIKRLTEALVARFPDYPHYGGVFDIVIPHLTIAQGDESTLDRVEREVSVQIDLPIEAHIIECALFERLPGRWREQCRFSLRM